MTAAPPPAVPAWPSAATIPPAGARPAVRAEGVPAPGEPMPPHYAHCFGCGDLHPTGLHLAVTAGEGVRVSATFAVTDLHQGAPGLAHGGLLAAAFDEAMGFLLWLLATPAVTARLETDFVLPVPVGTTLAMECECLGVERRKVYVRGVGRLEDGQGPVAVRAAGLFVAVPLAHFERHFRPGENVATDRSLSP